MIFYSEKFEFAAMHKLWNDHFSQEENFKIFGKCAHPAGHGHNYIIEVFLEVNQEQCNLHLNNEFEKTVKDNFLDFVDHKNLNVDIPEFKGCNPTVENIAQYAWNCLKGKFKTGKLHKIAVWENDRTCCTVIE